MIKRQMASVLKRQLARYPAATLIGPRQSGKTTLASQLGGAYFDLERETDRLRLDLEWENLAAGRKLVVLDEAQAWPEVFPRLRGTIDADRKRVGRFLLLGSVSPSLMVRVSESLAGRLSLVYLTPFLWGELPTPEHKHRLWLVGGFPDGGVLEPDQYPHWQLNYLTLLSQRDLPNWGLPAQPQLTDRFIRMLAAVHGQAWNASAIGKSLGLDYQTVNRYLDHLVGAFLLRRLQPYQANIRKRLVKNPKIYWRDSGLLHAVLNVSDADNLLDQPWVGASWEGFVIEQILGALSVADCRFDAYYFRTSDQYEIDLVLDFGGRLWAIEVKLTASPGPGDLRSLNKTADLIDAEKRILVTQTRESIDGGNQISCNLPWLLEWLPTVL